MKRTLLGLFLCLTLCGTTVLAQARHPQAAASAPSAINRPMDNPDAGLRKIFSNLGTPTDAYDSTNGYFVSGQNNSLNAQKQDIAIPFKPRGNATILQVKLALQYYGYGANTAQVAIYSDAGGLPGAPLAKADLRDFEPFGSGCCVLAKWRLRTGLPVVQGTQYWVVGTTDNRSLDSVNTWDFVWDDAPGTFAFQQNNGGWILLGPGDGYAPSAVAVYGSVP
jgi:hypothetical protein